MFHQKIIEDIYLLKHKSVLDVSIFVNWKKNLKKYNFTDLPKTVILSVNKNILNKKTRFFSKRLKGFLGANFVVNKNVFYCSEFGNGAPAIIGLLEELRALGVENFIFVGLAGIISENICNQGAFVVTNSFSTTGINNFYSSKTNFQPKDNFWFNNLKEKLNLKQTTCWSTDAPFRETKSLIDYFVNKKTAHVDMECAAIYAFAEFYNLNSLCCIVSADDLCGMEWNPPGDLQEVNLLLKQIVSDLIEIIK